MTFEATTLLLVAALCGCAAQAEPPRTPAPPRDVEAPAEPQVEIEEPSPAAEKGPPREVRDLEARPPAIEVLQEIRPRPNRLSRYGIEASLAVVGADLSARKALVVASWWLPHARSAESLETVTVVDFGSGRSRRLFREAPPRGEELVRIGDYTGSFASDLRALSSLLAEHDASYWGTEPFVRTPDGSHVIACSSKSRQLTIYDGRGRKVRELVECISTMPCALSPDGRKLATVCSSGNCIVDLETYEVSHTRVEPSYRAPLWFDAKTLYVEGAGREGSVKRIELGETLRVTDLVRYRDRVITEGLLADPARETAVVISSPPGDSTKMEAHWFRMADGELLAERPLLPYSKHALVTDGPLLVTYRDPDVLDGHAPEEDVLDVLDLSTGNRIELTVELLGGQLRGLHRAEHDGAEVLLGIRQPDIEEQRFELVRVDLASAFPPRAP